MKRAHAALPILAVALTLLVRAHAAAPSGQYATFGPTDVTIYDNNTRLTWQRGVSAQLVNQAAAISYCAALPLQGGGWRAPTYKELMTIVDEALWAVSDDGTPVTQAADINAFPNTPNQSFWSSSTGFAVDFRTGDGTTPDPGTGGYLVRCVR
jgi:hypothetical protein